MATKKKLLQAAAGNAGGAGPDVEDVFSTYLYEGTGSTLTITNGIDLDGEGGMVWFKKRNDANPPVVFDTERGATKYLHTSDTDNERTIANSLTSFNSDGFTIGADTPQNINDSSGTDYYYASWTFRKAPKFFDVVTYTGTGTTNNVISHNLDSDIGMVIIKRTDSAGEWLACHKDTVPFNGYLNQTSSFSAVGLNNFTTTSFTVTSTSGDVNASGGTYVAYLFAHNDGDGEFGPDGDADIIKCGSYTGNHTSLPNTISLGFEPQWVMVKRINDVGDWAIWDTMRGMTLSENAAEIEANTGDREADNNNVVVYPTADGFEFNDADGYSNIDGSTFIYIAIRRGTKVPESGTEVFATASRTADTPSFAASFPVVDATLLRNVDSVSENFLGARLTGDFLLRTSSTVAEQQLTNFDQDSMNGVSYDSGLDSTFRAWMWKRAPNFFDVVAYTGDGVAGRTVSHNLGVAPEMVICKDRGSSFLGSWVVGSFFTASTYKQGQLESDSGFYDASSYSLGSYAAQPDSSAFYVQGNSINGSGDSHIAYLFATLPGVSKVGSYTGNGTSQTIDCGFTSGARFILVKRTDSTGDWYVWDTERGIVTGNDPHLSLNTTAAEVTSDDSIDPDSSGFIVNQVAATNINVSSAEYIFYAIA